MVVEILYCNKEGCDAIVKSKGKSNFMNSEQKPTIYIITIHYMDKKWIEIQNRYIKRHTDYPYRIITLTSSGLESFTPKDWITIRDSGIESHAEKLNIAGDIAAQIANESDILVFMDSDCFPVNDWCDTITELVREKRMVAVQRLENLGDIQPHPCFACMDVKLWIEIQGDWRSGYKWINSNGNLVTDVGGNMIPILKENKINWFRLHRTNTFNPHPLFYGIYGNLFYHHGAGSRDKHERIDTKRRKSHFAYVRKALLDIRYYIRKNLSMLKKIITLRISSYDRAYTTKNVRKNTSMSAYYANKVIADEDILSIFQPTNIEKSGERS